ncbi:energy transducer TonB [Altererythrobacter aerius]|uniref:Energy transducer TonB n=1 Tax=Tsuneonella aeria TaxID=1837929 RepID=A0A6I4TBS1_9SPHN|nr:energy transducer TonB [Tsuneonella aeria]MXO74702.1 energy transducer TonB [Tsuneonella aeria]
MVFANLRREERFGLGIALALHGALAVALLVQPSKRSVIPPTQTMTVNLSTDVGLEATAPDPVLESSAAIAPTLAPEPAPPQESQPVSEPVVQPRPEPPRPVATAAPQPRPVPRATAQPRPRAAATAAPKPRASAAPAPRPRATSAPRPAGGNRIGSDFLAGAGESTTTRETRVPASQIGASAKASLFQAIARELRPRWQPPSGPEVEDLVTKLRFRLNPDGSLAGRPEIVRQTGITDVNRPQAGRHGEQAIRAVQLAAPFDLPEEYYEAWKVVTVDFDWKLSQ